MPQPTPDARFNDTAVELPLDRTVVEHVARHAAQAPDALAVADGRAALTYRELDARANRLAHVLRAHGARHEACVALCVAASVDMVLGALAALKAGAAYVPIDPDYPHERIELILQDTDPVAVLVDETTPPAVLEAAGERAIHLGLDPHHHDAAARDASAPGDPPGPRTLAYVVYTSGSTGRPKGVEVEHRSLANLALAQGLACGTTPADRLAQTASPSFDATVMEIWHPLVAGASLHIAPRALRRDPRGLVEWMVEQEISITMVATALIAMLFGRDRLYRRLTSMRRLMTGGAALLTRPAPDTPYPLVNMYGPTETTVVATQGAVPTGGDGPPTIGRPLANTLIHVLDQHRRPVGPGELGEIWIGGVQVARGYRGRPDLTAERFLPDPYAGDDSGEARMYRTGDLGVWREDGELEFHGRVDDQIAIRGYRIEPQEVEAALTSLPGIVDAVAIAVSHGRRGDQLAAYYTTTEPAPTIAAVRAHARSILPEYMVPTAYTRVEAFAFTPNGKIDRKALPAPTLLRADLDGAYVAPRTPREERVAAVFADVLELDEVGVDDDFFALGADSLDAVQCTGALSDELGRELTVEGLYANPTVARLLAVLDGDGETTAIDWIAEADPRLEEIAPLDAGERTADAGERAADAGDRAEVPGERAATRRARAADSGERTTDSASRAASAGERAASRADRTAPRAVLLTGASGFLGPHLLAELVAATRADGARVIALVRAPTVTAGAERLRRALLAERRDVEADWARVAVLPGDLAQPRFGLSEVDFVRLAGELGAIVHSGALVHHLYDYARLRAANVEGTREALRLARLAGGVPLRYVSSISTTLQLRDGALVERADADVLPPLGTGYGESKWVAEKMVLTAAASGAVPATVVRLPRAMGAVHSGATSTHDAAVRLIRGCVELGAYPEWGGWEPWAPVDALAHALAREPFAPPTAGLAYPPATIASWPLVFRAVAAYGYPLAPLPLDAWQERLRAAGETNAAAAVHHEFGLAGDGALREYGDTPARRGWTVTPQLDAPPCSPFDAEHVWRMLDYLVSVGYLTRPGEPATPTPVPAPAVA